MDARYQAVVIIVLSGVLIVSVLEDLRPRVVDIEVLTYQLKTRTILEQAATLFLEERLWFGSQSSSYLILMSGHKSQLPSLRTLKDFYQARGVYVYDIELRLNSQGYRVRPLIEETWIEGNDTHIAFHNLIAQKISPSEYYQSYPATIRIHYNPIVPLREYSTLYLVHGLEKESWCVDACRYDGDFTVNVQIWSEKPHLHEVEEQYLEKAWVMRPVLIDDPRLSFVSALLLALDVTAIELAVRSASKEEKQKGPKDANDAPWSPAGEESSEEENAR